MFMTTHIDNRTLLADLTRTDLYIHKLSIAHTFPTAKHYNNLLSLGLTDSEVEQITKELLGNI
ncbi:hypothetical protein SAMN05192566_0753 [Methylophilus rhizosphaerae]|uniref:Uncharacterized protein n=1 Tax=Methylophilus rhizosphaerae TaxID=492660 RepID=A0A1G9A8S0_9PROT|nr:hypothetical protein SAMN05192566_0753 [Methylophilus rhizosphaerae]